MSNPYAGGETWSDTIPIPEDGDPRDAASVAVPLEGLKNDTAYLKARGPFVRSAFIWPISAPAENETLFAFSSGSYASPIDGDLDLGPEEPFVSIEDVRVGDTLKILITGSVLYADTSEDAFMRLRIADDYEGTPTVVTPPSAICHVGATQVAVPFVLEYEHAVAEAGTTQVRLEGKKTGAGPNLLIKTAFRMVVEHSRLMP